MAERAMKDGKVTQADFEKWQRYGGDPWNVAGERAKALGFGGKDSKAPYLFGRPKWHYNVVDRKDGGVYVWTVGKQNQQTLEGIYSQADIFDEDQGHDVFVKGNGENGLPATSDTSQRRTGADLRSGPWGRGYGAGCRRT